MKGKCKLIDSCTEINCKMCVCFICWICNPVAGRLVHKCNMEADTSASICNIKMVILVWNRNINAAQFYGICIH